MKRWTPLRTALSIMLTNACMVAAAFEPVPESPLLQGGASSSLFPASPMVMLLNPASLGLLEGSGIAASASRPFGLRRLDRTALAGCLMYSRFVAGGAFSLSGDDGYTEGRLTASAAWRAGPGLALGLGASLRDLRISGYGRASGYSVDAGAAWSPLNGVYSTACFRGVLRSDLGSSGDPAAPRALEVAAGIVPFPGIRVAAGVCRQEGFGPEFSVTTAFLPVDAVSLSAGLLTDPTRFWAALTVSISTVDLGYGYAEHSALPGSHLVSLCYGGCGASPEPLRLEQNRDGETSTPDFPLDVNSATEEQLAMIPGIGPGRASAIEAWVAVNGPVTDIQMLDDVPGIGPSLLSVLEEYLEVR